MKEYDRCNNECVQQCLQSTVSTTEVPCVEGEATGSQNLSEGKNNRTGFFISSYSRYNMNKVPSK